MRGTLVLCTCAALIATASFVLGMGKVPQFTGHKNVRLAEHGALRKRAPMVLFTKSLSLSVLVLLLFAGQADAACWLHVNFNALPAPSKVLDDASRRVYVASYTQSISSACWWAFPPVQVKVNFRGNWDKAKKEATETVNVTVTDKLLSSKATYFGYTVQTCSYDPWSRFDANCNGWLFLDKAGEHKGAWNSAGIIWKGFAYEGPYPAMRRKIWWFWWMRPWG